MSNMLDEINENSNKEKEVLQKLKDTLAEVKRELNFAEAKNALGLTFTSAVFYKLIEYYSQNDIIIYKIIYFVSAIFLIIPIWKCLYSFNPNTNVFNDEGNEELDGEARLSRRVLIFYGSISEYKSSKAYLEDFCKGYSNLEINENYKEHLDHAKQILINSRITSYKYDSFKSAIRWIKKIMIVFIISMSTAFVCQKVDNIMQFYNYDKTNIVETNSNKN
ncbi:MULTISPECIES: hypothetical protein [Terrisporobacter]|uniref:Pycsar effector protein domain-containing protein n=1 Tax=Terrisporobacter muris TaxID=2963284 RepID=A0A9X2M978_9FIRM|nr:MULTISPECIES: hypothetical protein [Terrisporobacter]MCR1822558.1 hypothetical protein [Terrisporobacter muris]MDY3372606.1 hypothetical protein [Terrisporobacter othiniensis]